MSQVIGYLCSDDSLTAEVMRQVGEPLRAIAPEERVGMGIGWLQDGRSLLRKHPRQKAATVEVPALLADVPTRSLVGHVRHRSLGKAGTSELQPFRFRDWVYAQCGDLEGLKENYDALLKEMPDHVRRNIQGHSTAELAFHLFYTKVESHLSTTPKNDRPALYSQMMVESVQEIEKRMQESSAGPLQELAAVAVTDRCMVAARVGEPLYYRLIEGIEEPSEKPLFAGHKPKMIRHERFRALLVANNVADNGWEAIPDRQVMWVDSNWNIDFREI